MYRTNFLVRNIHKRISIYITKAFICTPITPHHVTLLSLGVFLLGAYSYANNFYLLGFVIFNFGIVLDCSDGEVARYKNMLTIEGTYFDTLTHYLVYPATGVGVFIGIYRITNDSTVLMVGSILAVAMLFPRLIDEVRYVAIVRTLIYPEEKVTKRSKGENVGKNKTISRLLSLNHLVYRFLYEYDEVVGLVTILVILCRIFQLNELQILGSLLYFYGLTYPAICLLLLAKVFWYDEVGKAISEIYKTLNRESVKQ